MKKTAIENLGEALTEIGKDIGNLAKVGKAVESQGEVLTENNQLLKQLVERTISQSGTSNQLSDVNELIDSYFLKVEQDLAKRKKLQAEKEELARREQTPIDANIFAGANRVEFMRTPGEDKECYPFVYSYTKRKAKIAVVEDGTFRQIWEGLANNEVAINAQGKDIAVILLGERDLAPEDQL
ncbi:hypothetical protein ACWIUA_12085 [Ursidibacter sp. B-7004-1]